MMKIQIYAPSPWRLGIMTFGLSLLLTLANSAFAQDSSEKKNVAAIFEHVLNTNGLDAALDTLNAALDDTTESYDIDGYNLVIDLPARLVLRHQRSEALELIKAMRSIFGEDPRGWLELANAHIRCGHESEACEALMTASELSNGRADIVWMIDNLGELIANAKLQAEREDRYAPGESTGLVGPYLGQSPPGSTPEVFAPGIVSTTAHEYHISFAPDGREIYFSRARVGTLVSRWESQGWTVPERIDLLPEEHVADEANITPDGRGIVFGGRSPGQRERDLYRCERNEQGWSKPERLFPGMYATSTLEGTLYYTARGEGRDYGAIVRRPWTGSGYGDPVVVEGEGINTEFPDAHPYIAPDEGLLLFDTYREPGAGIYVAFKGSDGSFGRAISLGEHLGIPPVGQCALSHDGKYLFFCLAGDMYWVDASFLEELRPQ